MLVQPINLAKSNYNLSRVNFKSYENHDGSPIPEIEQIKYHKTKMAEHYSRMGDFASAAKEMLENADICRRQGKERDAFLLETEARNLLKKVHPRI